jgi:hypothetical protein
MRATLNIPDEIIAEVQEITGEKTKTRAIVAGLKEFIRLQIFTIDKHFELIPGVRIYDYDEIEI